MRCLLSIILILLLLPCAYCQKAKHTQIAKIVDAYIGIKNALINDDGTNAKFKANDLYQILSTNPDEGLSHTQKLLLADNMQALLDNSRSMGEIIRENEQRQYFAQLSIALYKVLKQLKISTITLYEQYCPTNKLYWLSETRAIKNPYYNYSDKDNANCGKTVAVIR